jgi:hypothetical protein
VRRVAFLTLHDPGGFVIDDELAVLPLARRGIRVETIPWDRPGVDWRQYALVVIRSTWNMQKSYLRDLAGKGIETVPTLWRESLSPGELVPLFEELRSLEGVIKPVMSGTAQGAWRLNADSVRRLATDIEAYFANRALMMQPFERGIVEEGEFSMMYFNGVHSHSILKVPKTGEFRVQEEYGSELLSITPEPALLAAGNAAIAAIGEKLLYARVDFVRHDEVFRLMELELVEPSVYLRADAGAPDRFADAVAALVG